MKPRVMAGTISTQGTNCRERERLNFSAAILILTHFFNTEKKKESTREGKEKEELIRLAGPPALFPPF